MRATLLAPLLVGFLLSATPLWASDKDCLECHEDEAPTFKDNVHGQMYSLGYVTPAICSWRPPRRTKSGGRG